MNNQNSLVPPDKELRHVYINKENANQQKNMVKLVGSDQDSLFLRLLLMTKNRNFLHYRLC